MLLHKNYTNNYLGSDYVVGDIHGCYNQLQKELDRVGFNVAIDRLFSVGDIVDRGPESFKCLELFSKGWFHPVLGNHEILMLDTIMDGEYDDMWVNNGGSWYYQEDIETLRKVCKSIRSIVPYSLTVDVGNKTVGICHAEPPTHDWNDLAKEEEKELDPQITAKMIWGRKRIERAEKARRISNVTMTVHGHTITKKVIKAANSLFIDTGSFIFENYKDIGYTGVKIYKLKDLLSIIEE
jgi:serine/threonine protein phosphatase 1